MSIEEVYTPEQIASMIVDAEQRGADRVTAAVDAVLAQTPHQPQTLSRASFELNEIRRAIRPEGDMFGHGAVNGHFLTDDALERARADAIREHGAACDPWKEPCSLCGRPATEGIT